MRWRADRLLLAAQAQPRCWSSTGVFGLITVVRPVRASPSGRRSGSIVVMLVLLVLRQRVGRAGPWRHLFPGHTAERPLAERRASRLLRPAGLHHLDADGLCRLRRVRLQDGPVRSACRSASSALSSTSRPRRCSTSTGATRSRRHGFGRDPAIARGRRRQAARVPRRVRLLQRRAGAVRRRLRRARGRDHRAARHQRRRQVNAVARHLRHQRSERRRHRLRRPRHHPQPAA